MTALPRSGGWTPIGVEMLMNTFNPCVKIVSMETPQEKPLYWDSNKRPINFLLILAGVAAVLGLLQLRGGGEPTLLILGLGVAAYSWLTNAQRYLIFPEHLVIVFGTPRRRIIPFTQISHVEFLSLPTMGDRVRVRLESGRGIMLQAKDSETFHEQLDQALNNFHGPRPEYPLVDGGSGDQEEP